MMPAQIFKPLDDNPALIELLERISGDPRETVISRLLEEERCLGSNVGRALVAFGLKPHEWSDGLVQFYSQTNAFLYESSVWNRTALKGEVRMWITNYLREYSAKPLRILSVGDGLGFDSTALAAAGHEVVYFEPSQPCNEYARTVFAANGVNVRMEQTLDAIQGEQFDAVLCLDVLEHVPDPPAMVGMFSRFLKPNGILIAHAPFFLIHPCYKSHLRANRKYSGDWSLYQKQGLHPIGGQFFWQPIVLQKTGEKPPGRIPFSLRMGGWLLAIGRTAWTNKAHCLMARLMSRRDPRLVTDLLSRMSPPSGQKVS